MLLSRYLSIGGDPFDDRYYGGGSTVVMDAGAAVDESTSYKVPTVWRAVNVLAASIAVMPLAPFRRLPGGGKEVADIPEGLIVGMKPNRAQTSFRWRHHLMGKAILSGNYFAQRLTMGRATTGLWPLDTERMRVDNVAGDGSVTYRYTQKNGQPKLMSQDDVFHFRGFSRDGIMGVSVIDLMRDLVTQSNAAQKQRTSFIKNEFRPSAVFRHPKELKGQAYNRLEASLERNFSGPAEAGRTIIIEEGMDVTPFNLNLRDAQFVESDEFRVQEFLRIIGVPGVLCGYTDKTATHASAESFFQSFKDYNLFPWTKNLEMELTCFLLGIQRDLFFEFNIDALMRPDAAARAQFYNVLVTLGILTRNEVRELENRNPLPGLDEPLTPMNMGGSQPGQPGGGSKPPGNARFEGIVRAAAGALHRKEIVALTGEQGKKGAAARYAGDAAGWKRYVREFYSDHAAVVATRLQIPMATAERYCREQEDALVRDGVGVCSTWQPERLAALALE
jgi:HK97 family phage portal protein